MKEKILPHDHGQISSEVLLELSMNKTFLSVSELFKMLSDENRIRIFWLLCHCEECVLNLSVMMEMSSPAVSHHLKLLKSGGLITNRREGKEVYYKAAETEQAQLLHHMIEKIVKISCP